jgi:putative two-component system response regulator
MARLLIVDDEEMLRRSLRRTLERAGHAVAEAADVESARAVLQVQETDLVFCDINMPGKSGLELVRSLKGTGIAVVMLTGLDDPAIAEEALATGAYTYLVKPLGPNEILINTSSALRRRELELAQRGYLQELENKVVLRTAALRDALENLQMSESHARVAERETVDRLITALTLRSEETGAHIRRVGLYAALLAQMIRTPWTEQEIRHAAMLHDVGKIGIPDAILLKPGPLTSDEFDIIKRHCVLGASLMTETTSRGLALAAEIALTHHERWDGTGYPNALADQSIPLSGRIVAIADVFDALSSDRVYRPAMTVQEALAVMQDERGRQFDPDLLDRYVAVRDELEKIRRAHPDPSPTITPVGDRGTLPSRDPRELVVPASDRGPATMTLQEAADTLSVSSTTLRRWADAGRIEVERTSGGHRRFRREEVRRLRTQRPAAGSEVRKISPPAQALSALAGLLEQRGGEIHEAVVRSMYREGAEGWFASAEAAALVAGWRDALYATTRSGTYSAALTATDALARDAELAGTTLLERYTHLELFSERAVRELLAPGTVGHAELVATRRLFASLRQRVLDQNELA